MMRVRFWGVRGSIAAAGPETAQVGGNTSCVEVRVGDTLIIFDAGTGLRRLGEALFVEGVGRPVTAHLLLSHLHWDHIQGFPFFGPAYVPTTKIRIHGVHAVLEDAYRMQMHEPCFPVDFSQLAANIEFVKLEPDKPHTVGDLKVTPHLQLHSGDSFGYRFERDGKTVIYSTDSEHKLENRAEAEGFAAFFRDADVVIFDAMYALAEAISVKADWGHSSNIVGVELCQMARAKHLVLFHHEPANNDATLEGLLKEARRFEELTRGEHTLKVSAAFDGMEIDL